MATESLQLVFEKTTTFEELLHRQGRVQGSAFVQPLLYQQVGLLTEPVDVQVFKSNHEVFHSLLLQKTLIGRELITLLTMARPDRQVVSPQSRAGIIDDWQIVDQPKKNNNKALLIMHAALPGWGEFNGHFRKKLLASVTAMGQAELEELFQKEAGNWGKDVFQLRLRQLNKDPDGLVAAFHDGVPYDIQKVGGEIAWIDCQGSTAVIDLNNFEIIDQLIADLNSQSLKPRLLWKTNKLTGQRRYLTSKVPPEIKQTFGSQEDLLLGLVAATALALDKKHTLPHQRGIKWFDRLLNRPMQFIQEAQVPLLTSMYRKRIMASNIFPMMEDFTGFIPEITRWKRTLAQIVG